jgi:alpha-galactosidase
MTARDTVCFNHGEIHLTYANTPEGLRLSQCNPDPGVTPGGAPLAYPPFVLGIAGRPLGFMQAALLGQADLPLAMAMQEHTTCAERLWFRYRHAELGLAVECELQLVPGCSVIRQSNTVINEGTQPVVLTHFASASVQGICGDPPAPWADPERFRIHYCQQTWQGEGQWRSGGFEELGFIQSSNMPTGAAFHLSSIGSFSTVRFLPMLVVEDRATGKVWYTQLESSTQWHLEVGQRGSWTNPGGGLYLHADACDERFGGWARPLAPGERFTAPPAAWGCCHGDFGAAIRELTTYRRTLLPAPAWEGECPVVFNDYMNCLWGDPTIEALTPLIGAAARAGAEAFCIDAGWFGPRGRSWGNGLGDWNPSDDRFGPEGLGGVLRAIAERGMIPGLWLEMEVVGGDSELARNAPESWFLHRHGQRVNGGPRWFLNYANPEVCDYIMGKIDALIALGAGYFKNDYNDCVGIGDDTFGGSCANGLIEHARAFYAFIDTVRAKHPRLILENCGSGACRQDYGILSHFHLQSFSDQVDYLHCPSIIIGGLAGVVPEQYGIWAYPLPLEHGQKKTPELLASHEYQARMADGEQTIFNMVNGLCGNLYLSGRIDCADALNQRLIEEGVALYKMERPFIRQAHPVWPLGMLRFNDQCNFGAVALADPTETRLLLAVWRIGATPGKTIQIPFSRHAGRGASVRQIYPIAPEYQLPAGWSPNPGHLTLTFPCPNQARFFELKFQ